MLEVWQQILLLFSLSFLPGVDASIVYVGAWALGCFHSYILVPKSFGGAPTASVDSCVEERVPSSCVTTSGRVWRKVPESDVRRECDQYPNLSEGADRVGGQLRGDKECPFSDVTSGRLLEEGAGKRCSAERERQLPHHGLNHSRVKTAPPLTNRPPQENHPAYSWLTSPFLLLFQHQQKTIVSWKFSELYGVAKYCSKGRMSGAMSVGGGGWQLNCVLYTSSAPFSGCCERRNEGS